MRSMPMQFWPAEVKTPRMRMLAIRLRLWTSSRMMAGSLPPSSTRTGVRLLAAEAQTACATGRDPMNVMWLIEGWDVRWEATFGQHTIGWIKFGECPHAERAVRAMEAM